MNSNGVSINGGGDSLISVISNGKALTAREKKMLNNSNGEELDDSEEKRNVINGQGNKKSEEWQSVPVEILSSKQSINFDFNNSISTPINFIEAWSFFRSNDMSAFMTRRESIQQTSSVQRVIQRARQSLLKIVNQRTLDKTLLPERELILAIANCPMNNEIIVHQRIIQSIFVFLTKKSSCPRYGTHWEEIGFQGQDPASDLRGVGMYGALQLLFLSCAQETKDSLAPDILELSRSPANQFPLAVLSLNVTRMALDALRDGLLNKFCNMKNESVSVVNRFYLAIMYRIYKKWKENNLTIHDSCYLLKAVEKWSRAHPRRAIHRLEEYIAQNSVCNGLCACCNGICKRKLQTKKIVAGDEAAQHLSWLDLTKPSLEVFI